MIKEIVAKAGHNDEYLRLHFHQKKVDTIRNMYPVIFMMKPFYFNAQKYLNRKEPA